MRPATRHQCQTSSWSGARAVVLPGLTKLVEARSLARWLPRLLCSPGVFPASLRPCSTNSKKLTAEQRLAAFIALRASGRAEIGVGAASVTEIVKINILQASMLAMRRAVARLPLMPDLALVDGDRSPNLPCPVRCVVGGDATSLSIAAASIMAKVLRDRAMSRLALRFPAYGWETNAGYATIMASECAGTAMARPFITVRPSARFARCNYLPPSEEALTR